MTIPTTMPTSQTASNFSTSTKNKQKNSSAITKEQAEIEYLKVELNNACTEIVKLDTEIDEYKKKIVVLNARVKIMAERENEKLHGEYFPEERLSPSPLKQRYSGCPPPCHAQYHCSHQCHHQLNRFESCQAQQLSFPKLVELDQKIATVCNDVKALKD